MSIALQLTFDYASLDSDTRTFLQEQEAELDRVLKRTSEEIGVILLRVKQRLPHGQYMPWLASRGISQKTAWRCMQVAQGKEIKKSVIMTDLPLVEPDKEVEKEPDTTFYERWATDNQAIGLDRFGDPLPIETPESKETVLNDTVDIPEEEAIASLPKEQRDLHVMRVMGSSESPEWYTPQEIVQLTIKLLGKIDLDPCSNSRETPNVPADNHYTREDNGLSQLWKGKVYLNPPYGSEISQWVEKLVHEYEYGEVIEAIALLPGRIDTLWFQPLYEHRYPMCHVRGRIQYENSPYPAPFPCVIVYLGLRITSFVQVFSVKGPIMGRIG